MCTEKRIGEKGKIIGIDFSGEMLKKAESRIREKAWSNVNLVQADVTKVDAEKYLERNADAGVCSLGISIIPDYRKAYSSLVSCVRQGGEIILGDMQLAKGALAVFNPISVFLSRPFGGSWEGHRNSREVYGLMEKNLLNVHKEEYMFGSYFIAWAIKGSKS